MKKRVLVLGLVALLILGAFAAVAETAQAGCGTKKVDCRIKGDKKVGDSNFSMCYRWALGCCEPCHGYVHLAKWCNEHVKECDGKCWGCYSGKILFLHEVYTCYDKHGDSHEMR